jgi:hypothetical protein
MMTDTPIVTQAKYLIRKGAYWYRPKAQGYTINVDEAGRYTEAQAQSYTHPNGIDGPRDGMSYVHENEVPSPNKHLHEAITTLQSQLAEAREALATASTTLQWLAEHSPDCMGWTGHNHENGPWPCIKEVADEISAALKDQSHAKMP